MHSESTDGRLPLFILVEDKQRFHDILPDVISKIHDDVSTTHYILRMHDAQGKNSSSSASNLYVNSSNLLQELSETLSQEPIFSLSTNSLQHVSDAFISWGDAHVALENIFLYRGRLRIVVILLSSEAREQWNNIAQNNFPRYNSLNQASTNRQKKRSNNTPLVEKPIDPRVDFELVSLQNDENKITSLLRVLKPDLMLQRDRESTIRGNYLNEFTVKASLPDSSTETLSADQYAQQEIYPHLLPLMRRLTDCFQAHAEGKQLDETEERIIAKPLLFLGQTLRALSEQNRAE